MQTVELFSGTKSFSKVAEAQGHDTLTIDNNPDLNPDITVDILSFDIKHIDSVDVDVMWTSPPCTAFSVASIGRHWDKDTREPKTQNAKLGLALVEHTIRIIAETKPKHWFIENPRGMLRKLIDPLFAKHGLTDYVRHTVTYCQYGDDRMKPTDIWTNCKEWQPKAPCKNGMPCHVAAPRGSMTGTQGIKGAKLRGVIPPAIFEEIFEDITK